MPFREAREEQYGLLSSQIQDRMRVSGLLKLAGKYPEGLTAYRHIGGIHGKRTPRCSSIAALSAQKCPTKQPRGAQRRLTCYSALPSARRRCLKERHSSGFNKREVSSETRMLEEKLKQMNLRICFCSTCLLLG